MNKRVRGVLLTSNQTALLIKRVRPGRDPYWVFPGGGVEPFDTSDEEALHRELREELAATVDIVSLFHTLEEAHLRQDFYLCCVKSWDFSHRSGEEFTVPGRGEYALEEIPLTAEAIGDLNVMPPEAGEALRHATTEGTLTAGTSAMTPVNSRTRPAT